ncbi:MAG: Na/Pi cotransporter family protein [Hahellaceae bacterium]|nr:Na/Pi cotransporter family protein [Hahellaceae bacterium]MCP5213074.1 Na/Pi cotransporter family protein [Hahellaceae bacterium]
METLQIVGTLLGGLGLFLLSVGMMTDGLKQAAGNTLRKVLSDWTSTPFRGVLSGFFMTAIVQSSSAVTVASIGFVNAGLLTMRQTLGIIYGTNVGTTITGWLVAFIGFKFDIQAIALPMIGIGMLLRFTKKEGAVAAFGLALVGFGLFFVGVDVLKNAFEGLVAAFDVSKFTATGLKQVFIFLLLGVVMTILTQSSSASIALIITAAASELVGLYAAAAMVIGANVGTTSTAVLASLGATSNAKRVALAQVLFNVATGIVALIILPVILAAINTASTFFETTTTPGVTLALFHSVFNILGVLLVFPLNDRLATFLESRFRSHDETPTQPKFLDKSIATTPVLAVNAVVLELAALAVKVQSIIDVATANTKPDKNELTANLKIVKSLTASVSQFIASLERKTLSDEVVKQLAVLLRVDQYFLGCINNAENICKRFDLAESKAGDSYASDIKRFNLAITNAVLCPVPDVEDMLPLIQSEHDLAKSKLLFAGAQGEISVENMLEYIELFGEQLRMSQQWLKAKRALSKLRTDTGTVNRLEEPGAKAPTTDSPLLNQPLL